jgi:hypothetical protein
VIDLKTTGNINSFIFNSALINIIMIAKLIFILKMFGYELIFLVIDKKTHQLGLFDCSDRFIQSGANKVAKAVQAIQ